MGRSGEPPATDADTTLVARFTELLGRTQWALYDFIRGLVGEPELARDLTQDTFVDGWRIAKRAAPPFVDLTDEAGMRRWLFTVAYRHAAMALRRRRVLSWEPLDEGKFPAGDIQTAPVSFEDQIAEAEVLRAALLSVSPEDAACFLLQAGQGLSTMEIAAILEIAPDAVRKRLSRAKQRLRAAYTAQQRSAWERTHP